MKFTALKGGIVKAPVQEITIVGRISFVANGLESQEIFLFADQLRNNALLCSIRNQGVRFSQIFSPGFRMIAPGAGCTC
jgi:hypothetical protein